VDSIIARGGRLIPIEVKWTEHPSRVVGTLSLVMNFPHI